MFGSSYLEMIWAEVMRAWGLFVLDAMSARWDEMDLAVSGSSYLEMIWAEVMRAWGLFVWDAMSAR